jgi:hypothetical protein
MTTVQVAHEAVAPAGAEAAGLTGHPYLDSMLREIRGEARDKIRLSL